jgi:hypothetical protein
MPAQLLPFRDFDPHDVVNIYALNSGQASAGTLVQIANSAGWLSTDTVSPSGPIGAAYNNTVSTRWSVTPRVKIAETGTVFGMLLDNAGVELDENGEKLIYKPQKMIEMGVVPSGVPARIVTRGIFLVSGVVGNPAAAGDAACLDHGGLFAATGAQIGSSVFLGQKDANGAIFVKLAV